MSSKFYNIGDRLGKEISQGLIETAGLEDSDYEFLKEQCFRIYEEKINELDRGFADAVENVFISELTDENTIQEAITMLQESADSIMYSHTWPIGSADFDTEEHKEEYETHLRVINNLMDLL